MFDISINDLRSWHTVVLLVAFIGIILWAYSRKRRTAFDEAANLPFADHDLDAKSVQQLKAEEGSNKENLS